MPHDPEWLTSFRKAIMQLETDIRNYLAESPDISDACANLVGLHTAKTELGIVYDGLSHAISEMMDQQAEVMLEDGSKVEKKFSSDRKGWQHKELASVVAERITQSSVNMDTGEILNTQEELIARLLEFVQPSYWRVKELSKIGINADLYCEVGDTKTSIIVRKVK